MIDLIRRGQTNVYGQVSDVVVKGNTWTNKAGVGDTSPQTVANLDIAKSYLLINSEGANVEIGTVDTPTPAKLTGATSFDFVWASGKIALYELSAEEATLDASVLGQKYHYVSGTKSTNSVRVKSVGKNLFDGEIEYGSIASDGRPYEVDGAIRSKNFTRINDYNSLMFSTSIGELDTRVYFYDSNKKFIGYGNVVLGNVVISSGTNLGAYYIKWRKLDGNADLNCQVQVENNTVITSYEPYRESIAYINWGTSGEGKSVGSANDEYNATDGTKTQRVKKYVLQASDVAAFTSSTEYDYVRIKKPLDYIGYGNTLSWDSFILDGFRTVNESNFGNTIDYDISTRFASVDFYARLPKGKYADLASARTGLEGLTLIYQLAEPVVTQLDPQPLTIFPNGTQYIEFGTKEVAEYADGINISNAEIPIKAMKTVDKLHIEDGHWKRTAIDLANVAVSPDGLSFTIADAVNGETYEYSYDYDSALSTLPDLEVGEPSLVTRNNRTIVL